MSEVVWRILMGDFLTRNLNLVSIVFLMVAGKQKFSAVLRSNIPKI